MRKSGFWRLAAPCILILASALAIPSIAMQGDTIADRVLGQLDFAHTAANVIGARGLSGPLSTAVDVSVSPNRLYVADTLNSRVLAWKDVTAFSNGSPANFVIGQPDFSSGACNNNGTANASNLCHPSGIAVDALGNLYVADSFNHRVLEYHTPFAGCGSFPCVGGTANLVFGQGGSFTSGSPNNGGLSANSLDSPSGVAVDGAGNVYITDLNNSRVLEYNSPLTVTATPGSGDTTADLVFGQAGSFTSGSQNNGGLSANSLNGPFGVALDPADNLYVTDVDNGRVLEYNTPLTVTATPGSGDTTADLVFGQGGSFASAGCNSDNNGGQSSAIDLCFPNEVAVDSGDNVYVADTDNNRVLEFKTPFTTDTTADVVLGQPDFSHNIANMIDASNFFQPFSVAIDRSAAPNRLYVSDTNNNRVLGYKNVATFANGGPADLVVGQPDFTSGECNYNGPVSSSNLCSPYGVAVDAGGNLYVSDDGNSRVL